MSLTQTKLSRRSRGNNPSAFSLPLKCIWEELVRMDKKQGKKWSFFFRLSQFCQINITKQAYLWLYSRNRLIVSPKWAPQGWAFCLSFPRVRARIPSNFVFLLSQPSPITPISYDFGAFSCHSLLSLCELSFSTFGVLQRHFIAPVLNFVRKTILIHCVSIYYRDFCEGCESKKCKTPVMRVRARGTPTLIFHKRKHFIFHLPFLPSRRLRQKVQEKVRQKRNYLGRFSKNVGDFLKNVGVFSKNVGDFQRFLRRYLYSIQHIPRSATILHFAKHYCYCLQWFPFKTGLVSLSDNGFCAVEQAHS